MNNAYRHLQNCLREIEAAMAAETTMKTLTKLRAWIIYGGHDEWLHATLVCENGWAPFSHICSAPFFMDGDLILNRPDRQEILAEMGYEIELVGEPIAGSDNSPPGLLELHKAKAWQPLNEEYMRLDAARKEQP